MKQRPNAGEGRSGDVNASRGNVAPESVSLSIEFGFDFEPGEMGSLKLHAQLPAREFSTLSADRPSMSSTGVATGAFKLRGDFVSQQQPEAGLVTQQQPFRIISAARALPVAADGPPVMHRVPMTAKKTAQKTWW